jgi:S-adenosylmethionine uptake transporter
MASSKGQQYIVGISWFILSLVISNLNDVLQKYLGTSIHPAQTTFCRCLFGTLSLLPFMFWHGLSSFKTQRPILHVVRGGLLYFGIAIWIAGLGYVPLATATIMTFTIPLFILMMAPIFLGGNIIRVSRSSCGL